MNKQVYSTNMELNKIYLGDAYELIKDIPSKSVDLIMTDPPYQINGLGDASGMFRERKTSHKLELHQANLGVGVDLKILDDFVRVMKLINIYL